MRVYPQDVAWGAMSSFSFCPRRLGGLRDRKVYAQTVTLATQLVGKGRRPCAWVVSALTLPQRLDPEVVWNRIATIQNKIGHHLGHFRGHAKADLEPAIRDKVAGAARKRP